LRLEEVRAVASPVAPSCWSISAAEMLQKAEGG
jgi:hypothetical protein